MGRVRIVILGGSFGGLSAAYELRRHLPPKRAAITLLAKDERFRLAPSFPWVAIGRRSLEQISFGLAGPLARKQVAFAAETVTGIDTGAKVVTTASAEHRYDFLVIATGHRSANEAVDGLGPFDGPVYELAFELDHLLRRRKLRHQVPITLLTPEPFLGHIGMGGAGTISQLLEAALEERDITYRTSVAITKVTTEAVEAEGLRPTPSRCSIILPPLAGVDPVSASPGLSNPKGFIPVDDHYRHHTAEGVFAVGAVVALPPAGDTPVPVNFPKTGHMTEQMADIAARDLAARIAGREGETAELSARCVLDMGNRGAYMAVDPVRPPRNRIPTVSEGRQWLYAKRAFERAYLATARRGRRMPTTLGW